MKPWKDWFQPHILERGRAYLDEGRVSELERTEDSYAAIVEGTEDYEVEILLEGGFVEDMLCDCLYAEDGNAYKHMAAVLFAVAAAEPSKKKASAKKERLTPAGLAEKIPDGQLRPLLTELISADEKFYRDLLLRYGETSLDECMKTLKEELVSIGDLYADRHGYINYRDANDFECDMADLLGGRPRRCWDRVNLCWRSGQGWMRCGNSRAMKRRKAAAMWMTLRMRCSRTYLAPARKTTLQRCSTSS